MALLKGQPRFQNGIQEKTFKQIKTAGHQRSQKSSGAVSEINQPRDYLTHYTFNSLDLVREWSRPEDLICVQRAVGLNIRKLNYGNMKGIRL